MPTQDSRPNSTPPANLHLWQIHWVRDLAGLLLIGLALWLAYLSRAITTPLLIAVVLAYIFNPLVTWADRCAKIPRLRSTLYLILLVGLAGLGFLAWALPRLLGQVSQLARHLPRYVEHLGQALGTRIDWTALLDQAQQAVQSHLEGSTESSPSQAAPLSELAQLIAKVIVHAYRLALGLAGWLLETLTYVPLMLIIIAFCFFIFSWRWADILAWFEPLIPHSQRDKTLDVLGKMDRCVAAFVRGRLIQALVMGLVLSAGWGLLGVPYWLILGMVCGLLNLVPFLALVGCLLAVGLVLLDSFTTGAGSIWMVVLWPVVIFGLAQGIDGWVVEPLVQGRATNLGPLTILLAVLIGASLAGVLGMILAIPLTACLKILAQEVIVPHLRREAARQ